MTTALIEKQHTRLKMFSVVRNAFPKDYFTADDALEAWQEEYPEAPELKKRNVQMMLSRLVKDRLLSRPLYGVYAVRKASGKETSIRIPEKTKPTLPKVRRLTS